MPTIRGRMRLPCLLAAAFALLTVPCSPRSVEAAALHGARSGPLSCSGILVLVLRPGPVPPFGASWNRPPAHDIPPGPLIERFPLYTGAVPSRVPVPVDVFSPLPPDYRKAARAEFQVPAGYQAVSAWFQRVLAGCGLSAETTIPLQRHGGPPFAGIGFVSRDGLSRLSLTFRPLSPRSTAMVYVAQTLDLPPRPAASYLRGPFIRVRVDFRSQGVIRNSNYRYQFTITWPATIVRLVAAINRPTEIWVELGGGGLVLASQSVRLSFVRVDGGIRRVSVGGVLDRIVVGHTRPLVDTDARVIRLVSRIAHRRCGQPGPC